MVEEETFEADTPGVAAKGAIRCDDTVTGNDDGQRVVVVGAAHGARGTGLPQRGRQFAIGRGRAVRQTLQRLPHFQLEGGAPRQQGQIEVAQRAGEITGQLISRTEPGAFVSRPVHRWGSGPFVIDEPQAFDPCRAPGYAQIADMGGDVGVVNVLGSASST